MSDSALRTGLLGVLAGVGLALCAGVDAAGSVQPVATSARLAIEAVGAKGDAPIDVGSFSWASGKVPRRSSAEGRNLSPDVYWTGGPTGTKTYAVVIEDADAQVSGRPAVHLLLYDLPEVVTRVPEGGTWETPPPGMKAGLNYLGKAGYAGPKPPPGGAHAYHIEVFAVDRALGLPEGADRDQVVKALSGHVLGAGEAVGAYQAGAAL